MISKGEQFPSFSLENQDGNFISNETIKGRKTILYFIQEIIHQRVLLKLVNLEITLKILINLM